MPFSIATKEILPKLQKDTGYLRRNNMDVLDYKGQVLDPQKINWKKFSLTYFPYKIRQREGDENTLGLVKFNFPSKFGIYMHDTKDRNLFGKELTHQTVSGRFIRPGRL